MLMVFGPAYNDGEQLEFDFRGHPIPQPRCEVFFRPYLAVDNSSRATSEPVQLTLPLQVGPELVTVMLRRSAIQFLDFGVFDVFRTSPAARAGALRLERQGVLLIGDLVQQSRVEIEVLLRRDSFALAAIEAGLQQVGLRFGLKTPQWKPPRRLLAAG